MKMGHHLLDLVGTGPYNRMVQLICQAINESSIPTRAGMTVYGNHWLIFEVQMGVGAAQVMVQGRVEKFYQRGRK